MPDVLMNILSPLPFSTTLVSPVTILIFALSAAFFILTSTSQNSFIVKPSSMIKPKDIYLASAPHIAISFTVPLIAKSPIFPPGKKIGEIT